MLTDSFGRIHSYLRISLTEKCNLRCIYCMPEEGVPLSPKANLLQDDELLRLVNIFAVNGVNKIRFTGGEPLVRKNAVDLIGQIAQVKGIETLAMTTNGLLLAPALPDLQQMGFKGLNISLDTLQEAKFLEMTRRKGLDKVLSVIDEAIFYGFNPRLNIVVMKGYNEDELADFAALTLEKKLDVRYIEFMPFDGNRWNDDRFMSFQEMKAVIEDRFKLEKLSQLPSDTAQTFKIPSAQGSVGFIASMSAPFCAGCNRLRLGADGNFRVCLFAKSELNLRDLLRNGASDVEITQQIKQLLHQKKAQHDGMYQIAQSQNQPMILIGG